MPVLVPATVEWLVRASWHASVLILAVLLAWTIGRRRRVTDSRVLDLSDEC